jgi:hypothetical protein
MIKESASVFGGGWDVLRHLIMRCVVTGLLLGKEWEIAPGTLKLRGDSGLSFVGVGWICLASTLALDDQICRSLLAFLTV